MKIKQSWSAVPCEAETERQVWLPGLESVEIIRMGRIKDAQPGEGDWFWGGRVYVIQLCDGRLNKKAFKFSSFKKHFTILKYKVITENN